jgi:hypothetical protein
LLFVPSNSSLFFSSRPPSLGAKGPWRLIESSGYFVNNDFRSRKTSWRRRCLAVDSFFGAAKEGTGGIDENPYSIVPKMYSWISFLNFSLKKTNPNSLFPKIGLKKKSMV